jgi:hypothetical protein
MLSTCLGSSLKVRRPHGDNLIVMRLTEYLGSGRKRGP